MTEDETVRITKGLIDQGKLIEAGWVGFANCVFPDGAGAQQLESMRQAFFAGAQHLFGSIMHALEEGDDATESDMKRMDNIHHELTAFIEDFQKRYLPHMSQPGHA